MIKASDKIMCCRCRTGKVNTQQSTLHIVATKYSCFTSQNMPGSGYLTQVLINIVSNIYEYDLMWTLEITACWDQKLLRFKELLTVL